jgi:hypothetical protein
MNVVVPIGLEQRLRVGAIGLVAADVPMDVVRGQQAHGVTLLLELPRPVVRRPTGFEQDRRRRLLDEVRQEPVARQATLGIHAARLAGDRDLKHGLCEIDGDSRMLHLDSSLPLALNRPFHARGCRIARRSPFHQ